MIMPSYTTLPESMLGAPGIYEKFSSQSFAGLQYLPSYQQLAQLRGLGCGCSEVDDSGNCMDPDPCETSSPIVTGGDNTILPVTAGGPTLPQGPTDSGCGAGQQIDPATGVCTGIGNTVQSFCTQQGLAYNSSTGLCVTSTGGPLSTSQQLALDQSIVNAGSQLSRIIAAGATGTTVLPNGTVISPGATTAGVLGAAGSGTVLLLVAVAFGLMALRSGK